MTCRHLNSHMQRHRHNSSSVSITKQTTSHESDYYAIYYPRKQLIKWYEHINVFTLFYKVRKAHPITANMYVYRLMPTEPINGHSRNTV
jgi:hypothetical protein